MRHTTLAGLMLLLLNLFFCITVRSQYYFDKITEENGLSDNRVSCFLKDKTGFVWVGTKNGLNRYDGHSFKIFRPGSGNSISNEVVNDIIQDSSGRIWVATMGGVNIYDPVTNRWEGLRPNNAQEGNDLPSFFIWDLLLDNHKQLWIVSDVKELSTYDPVTKKFTYYNWPAFAAKTDTEKRPTYRSIRKIVQKTANEYWLATNIGLYSLNTKTKEFQFYGSGYRSDIRDLCYDAAYGNVFIVTDSEELFCYNERQGSYVKINIKPRPVSAAHRHYETDMKQMHQLAHPKGLLEVNRITKEVTLIASKSTLPGPLLPGGVNAIYTDSEGLSWVATNNGINKYDRYHIIADFIPLMASTGNETEDGMGAAIYDPAEDKYLVCAIDPGSVFTIDGKTGVVTNTRFPSPCLGLYLDNRNDIWLLTETNVHRYDRTNKKFVLFPTPNNGSPVIFRDMLQDEQGNYWFSTWRDWLYLYKTAEKKFYEFPERDSMYGVAVTALASDTIEHAVWIGSSGNGVYRYDLATSQFSKYGETPGVPEYLQLNIIEDIESDASGKIWFTTWGGGLYVYHRGQPHDKSFSHLTMKQGLSQNDYFSISSDAKGKLWLLSGKGLSAIDTMGRFLFDVRGHPAMSFSNYAPDRKYSKNMFFNHPKDEILVGVNGGLLIYYPAKNIIGGSFPLVLTDIIIGDRSVLYDSSYINNRRNIRIPYQSNSVSFQFAALHYNDWEDIRYEYKLHDDDPEWKPAGNSHSLYFPDLPPGRYKFTVRGKNGWGNMATASFSFIVKPPFWRTWWFIVLFMAALAVVLYKWIKGLRRRIRSEKILNYFATSLYGQNTVEDVFWDIAKNCITQLNFQDCVIYQYDEQRQLLIQKAAYGPKNPERDEILNPIEIPIGKGITGAVAASGKAEIVADTSKDKRYIIDDKTRLSEIAVPIMVDGKIFGIIDSEHQQRNFYSRSDLRLLQKIADTCATKISRYLVEDKLRTKIARDLHDEMGSTLTSINIISKMAMDEPGGNENQKNYMAHIKDYSGKMMESMSDMVWAINPANDTIDKMLLRMKEFAAEILEPARINYFFKETEDLDSVKLNPEQRKDFFLIYKESLTNAAKYSRASEITVSLERQDAFLIMRINDNGKGFDASQSYKGNGVKNMRSRAIALNAGFAVRSAPGAGTDIQVKLRITPSGDAG